MNLRGKQIKIVFASSLIISGMALKSITLSRARNLAELGKGRNGKANPVIYISHIEDGRV